jgi:hypothetical protein
MRLTLDQLWLLLAVALPALLALLVPLPAVDLAYQVRAGEEILRTGTLPAVDTYTFTVAGTPWIDQQWLAQVKLAAGYRTGGWELLAVLRAVLVAVSFGLLAATAVARGSSPRTAAILSLLAFGLAAPALALRPQLFGIAIFAVLLYLVAVRGRHPGWYWLAPALVVLWANIHGSFVLAPVLLGYAWLDDIARGRPARTSLLVLVAGTAASLLNPFGLGVWSYAIGIGVNPAVTAQASEWQRTTPFSVPGLLFYTSAAAGLLVAYRGRAALRWPDWLWLATMFAIGAWTVRGLAWWPFGVVFVVAAALPLARLSLGGKPASVRASRASRFNSVVAAALGVALVAALPWWRPPDPLTGRVGLLSYAPSGLALALRDTAPGARVVAPQPWTSWFEWAAPDAAYFVDARFELFPPGIWSDYDAITAGGPEAAELLDQWAADIVIVPADEEPNLPGWARVHEDADGAVLARTSR